eukprot:gene5711-4074_t
MFFIVCTHTCEDTSVTIVYGIHIYLPIMIITPVQLQIMVALGWFGLFRPPFLLFFVNISIYLCIFLSLSIYIYIYHYLYIYLVFFGVALLPSKHYPTYWSSP